MTRSPVPFDHRDCELSVVIIAQDEERNLAELLPRLRWSDEIVVVDGGSRDGSRAVVQQQGCRLLVRPFDDFASQRNFGLEQARGRWVLSLDADERPSRSLAREARRVIARDRYEGYRIPIHSVILGRRFRFSGTQDDRPVRLVRRAAARWSGTVHERLEVAGPVATLASHLDHHTLPDLAAFAAKIEHYTTLAARTQAQAIRPGGAVRTAAACREVFRRLIWKQGCLDGPEGWTFSLLSGFSEWLLAYKIQQKPHDCA